MAISIQQVAKRAGVSPATVSKILNKTDLRFKEHTLLQVQQAAEEMGYQPNRVARSLRGQKSKTIGVMLFHMHNPFFASVVQSLEQMALAAGYQIFLDTAWSDPTVVPVKDRLHGWPVDGIIIWSRTAQDLTEYFGAHAKSIPTVYLGYEGEEDVNSVALDLESGQRQVMEHLLQRGYTRFAYATSDDKQFGPFNDVRWDVCAEVCQGAGLHLEPVIVPHTRHQVVEALQAGLALANRPIAARPKVVVCHNDIMAMGIYHGLRRAKVLVPSEVAVTGFDGTDEGQCLDLPLTSVHAPVEELCRIAFERLTDKMDKGETLAPLKTVIPMTLLVGETS